jgi:hypothetical protein
MTAFRQGPTPWFRVDDGSRMMARGIDRESVDNAMRWAQESERQQPRRDEAGEFVRDAIQRCYS